MSSLEEAVYCRQVSCALAWVTGAFQNSLGAGGGFFFKDRHLPQCQALLIPMGEEEPDLSLPYVPISNRSKDHNVKVPVSPLTVSRSCSVSYVML